MKSEISKKPTSSNQMWLVYDALNPEEANKLMEAITADDLCQTMSERFSAELYYSCYGCRRSKDGEKFWARDLIFSIQGQCCRGNDRISVEEMLEQEREDLEEIRIILKEKTGIE